MKPPSLRRKLSLQMGYNFVHPSQEGDGLRIKELEYVLEEKKRSVCSLEDHISTLKFHLEQKSNELEDARRLLALNSEKSEQIMEQMRRTQEIISLCSL